MDNTNTQFESDDHRVQKTSSQGRELPVLFQRLLKWELPDVRWSALDELTLITLWSIWVGRAYLNFDQTTWPLGREFPMAIQSHFIWDLLVKCGACVTWNGFINGGAPAFVELHGAPLHPIVISTTLVWGAVNGAKATLIISLVMAGVAQWWLARVMGLGFLPRVWGALLAVAGGHLFGRMENGLVPLVLSTASVSLAIAAGVDLALTGRRRSTVLLGIALALTILSGQGYLQIGLLFGLLPAFLVFWFDEQLQLQSVWKEFLLAGGLALMLTGMFVIPLVHFWPSMDKGIDPNLSSAQPLEYVPLNLVIRDISFFRSEILHKRPYPYLYINYISWIPLLLAFAAIRLVPRSRLRLLLFFLLGIVFLYAAASATTLRLILGPLSSEFLQSVRNPAVIAGLAVPLVIGLAAWGLDHLLELDWPEITLSFSSQRVIGFSIAWLVLAIPLLWSIKSSYDLGRNWLRMVSEPPGVRSVLQGMETDSTQWIRPPFGEHFWVPAALESGFKIAETYRPWGWSGREFPPLYIEGTRDSVDQTSVNFLRRIEGVNLIVYPENQYAYVDTGSDQVPCEAISEGGNIDVVCNNHVSGTLVVRENQWSGWSVRRDGESAELITGKWLSVDAPAGQHRYEFRYRPWDVALGLFFSIIGVCLSIWLWFTSPTKLPDSLPSTLDSVE